MENNRVSEEIGSRAAGAPSVPLSCTRRQTLIWGGASLLGLSALEEVLARGYDRPLIIMEQAEGMIMADPVLCVGCGRCVLACTEFNDGKAAPSLARIKIDRNLNFGPPGATPWRAGHGNWGDGLIVQDLCRHAPPRTLRQHVSGRRHRRIARHQGPGGRSGAMHGLRDMSPGLPLGDDHLRSRKPEGKQVPPLRRETEMRGGLSGRGFALYILVRPDRPDPPPPPLSASFASPAHRKLPGMPPPRPGTECPGDLVHAPGA